MSKKMLLDSELKRVDKKLIVDSGNENQDESLQHCLHYC